MSPAKILIKKRKLLGSVTVVVLLLLSGFIGFMILPQTSTVRASTIGDFTHYKTITIESDYVATSLANFPVWVYNVSDTWKTNETSFSFFQSDNVTECNWELEHFEYSTGTIGCWVNVSNINSASDTTFFIYYDTSNTTDGGEHNPTNTWHSDYKGVWHMNEASGAISDSTSNAINGAVGVAPTYEVTGASGYAMNFTNASYFDFGHVDLYNMSTDDFTIECWITSGPRGVIDTRTAMSKINGASWIGWFFPRIGSSEKAYHFRAYVRGSGTVDLKDGATSGLLDWGFHYCRLTKSASKTEMSFDDRQNVYSSATGTGDISSVSSYYIGCVWDDSVPAVNHFWNGSIDEVRISKNIARNDSWLNATYTSINAPATFLTFGSGTSSEGASVFVLKGVSPGYNITWAGTVGTTVWCNSSGSGNEWFEINMTINATDNVTNICVWVGDLNDTGAYINASNITMYVSSDNSSYGEMGTFTDGGSNCSNNISSTNWNAGTMGSNPFSGVGLTDKTASIFVTFKLSIPSGLSADVFYSASKTAWKVYIGRN